jgi:membrane protease YdiL (CAAX protease family)
MERSNKKSVIIFSIIAILCGWLGVLVDSVLPKQREGSTLGMLIWLVLPLLSAVLIRTFIKNSWKPLGVKPKFKTNWKWYIISFVLFPIITLATRVFGYVTGWTDFSKFNLMESSEVFFGVMAYNLFKNIFEELAWRGFLTERLITLKMSDWKIYSIVAVVWGTWHIPYYLFFLNIGGSRIQSILTNYMLLFCWIILFTEIYRLTRSIWPCVILHAVVNSLVVINDYISIQEGKIIFISYDTGIISLAICVCLGLVLRSFRIQRDTMLQQLGSTKAFPDSAKKSKFGY